MYVNPVVCCLASSVSGLLVSGSWDTTARVWNKDKCLAELKGHKATIWSTIIVPSDNSKSLLVATGSADKTINIWNINDLSGNKIYRPTPSISLQGHLDCVRSLIPFDENYIFSASNDGTLRVWNLLKAQCVGEYHGHTNFVYSIAIDKELDIIVSSGEDRTVRIWNIAKDKWGKNESLECRQVITLPCVSVWSVGLLSNGDIAAGGSDCQVRIFSTDPGRQGSIEDQSRFKEELASAQLPKQTGLSGSELSEDKLPGVEALLVPGKREGQILVVKEDGKSICYQWSQIEVQWIKVGDVIGSGSSKHWHEGKEYDFIFDVDVDPSRPTLRLPFNKSDDPWLAAQQFIQCNGLPQDYLETVAKYIIQNAGLDKESAQFSNEFTDPFTGGGRYMPKTSRLEPTEVYFPATKFVSMMSVQVAPLLKKLRSINELEVFKLDESTLELIGNMNESMTSKDIVKITESVLPVLNKWNGSNLLPIFDVIRFCGHWQEAAVVIFNSWNSLWTQSIKHPDFPITNCLLFIRLLCNAIEPSVQLALSDSPSAHICLSSIFESIHPIIECLEGDKFDIMNQKMMQVALATLFHNLSVLAANKDVAGKKLANKYPIIRALHGLCLRVAYGQIRSIFLKSKDSGVGAVTTIHPEAIFRLLVTIGTSLVSVCQDKAERVCLLTSCATGDGEATSPEAGSSDFSKEWNDCMSCVKFWAETEVVAPKARECASEILSSLE